MIVICSLFAISITGYWIDNWNFRRRKRISDSYKEYHQILALMNFRSKSDSQSLLNLTKFKSEVEGYKKKWKRRRRTKVFRRNLDNFLKQAATQFNENFNTK